MRSVNWNISTPIKIALYAELIFVAAFTILFSVLTYMMVSEFRTQQDAALNYEYLFFKEAYDQGGPLATVAAVERNTRANVLGQKIYVLTTANGGVLAGNIELSELPAGWIDKGQAVFDVDLEAHYQARVFPLGTMHLVIGVNGLELSEIIETAVVTLIWGGLAAFVLSIGIGLRIAKRMQRRLNHIAEVLHAISKGDLHARIALDNQHDDVGVLATHINHALGRLEDLVSNVQQVSADVAHDLRTPVTRLQISLEALQERLAADPEIDQEFDRIIVQSKQIQSIFSAILRVVELESGTLSAAFTTVDLSNLCQELYDTYKAVCEEHQQTLTFDASDSPVIIQGDTALIFQLLANVIENAIQHSPTESHIHLDLSDTQVSVSDDGPGIPEGEYEKVFQRLYRLDRSRMTPGTGLGLNIVKAIADAHGASVQLSDQRPGLKVTIVFKG